MDRHSEIEMKFQADQVSADEYERFMLNMKARNYHLVDGVDTFYRFGSRVLRFRNGDGWRGLTIKQRKSTTSIIDRVEIDLEIGDSANEGDVEALIHHLGGVREFSIRKLSRIWRVPSAFEVPHEATFALYDVYVNGMVDARYLEVEIERDNECTPEQARKALDKWETVVKNTFKVVGPMNRGLYEIYSEKVK